jgi:hypothetical protein
MKELQNAQSGNSTPSTPNEIQLVFNSSSPFEVYAGHTYNFKVIDRENAVGSVQYLWKVVNGRIMEGQGGPRVKVIFNQTYGGTIAVQACSETGKCSTALEQYIKIHKK